MSNDISQSGQGDGYNNESSYGARRSVYGAEGLGFGQSGSAAGGGNTQYSGQTANGTAMMTYKVREFEWFEVETKVRKFVNELLQPTIKKVSLDKRLLEEINERITANDEQVKGLYDFIHYTHNRVKVLDDIHEKIAQTNSGLEMAMNRNNQHEEKVQLFEDNLKREFNSMKSEVANVLKAKDQLSEDRRTLMEYFENFKRNTQDIISSLTKELSEQQSATKTEFVKTWDAILKQQNVTHQHSSDLVIHSDKMSDIFQRISAFKVKNTQYDNQIDRMEKEIDSLQKNISIAKKFTNKVEDLQNKFRMVENYIEKYSGMYVQGQISDTLFNVLESKAQKKRLLTFEEKTFSAMNQRILMDDGQPDLGKKIDESILYLESITKRNAKYLHTVTASTTTNRRANELQSQTTSMLEENSNPSLPASSPKKEHGFTQFNPSAVASSSTAGIKKNTTTTNSNVASNTNNNISKPLETNGVNDDEYNEDEDEENEDDNSEKSQKMQTQSNSQSAIAREITPTSKHSKKESNITSKKSSIAKATTTPAERSKKVSTTIATADQLKRGNSNLVDSNAAAIPATNFTSATAAVTTSSTQPTHPNITESNTKKQNMAISPNSKSAQKQQQQQQQQQEQQQQQQLQIQIPQNSQQIVAVTGQQQQQQLQQPSSKTNRKSKTSIHSLNSGSDDDEGMDSKGRMGLKAFIESEMKRIHEMLERKTWSLQKGLLESEEILSLNVSKIQEEMERGIMLLRKEHNNVVLETGALDAKISTIWNELAKIVKTFNVLSETVHKLIHFNTLFNSLALQDELDKQSIALYGYNTTFSDDPLALAPNHSTTTQARATRQFRAITSSNTNNHAGSTLNNASPALGTGTSSSLAQTQLAAGNAGGLNATANSQQQQSNSSRVPLQLDGNCLSCSGNSAQMMHTFKIACLAYNPSAVNIDGQTYKREEILEVATRLLQAARQQYGLKSNPTDISEAEQLNLSNHNTSQTMVSNNNNNNEQIAFLDSRGIQQNSQALQQNNNYVIRTNNSNSFQDSNGTINHSQVFPASSSSASHRVVTAASDNPAKANDIILQHYLHSNNYASAPNGGNGVFSIPISMQHQQQQQQQQQYQQPQQQQQPIQLQRLQGPSGIVIAGPSHLGMHGNAGTSGMLQGTLPQLDGLKPRSRAISSQKKPLSNSSQLASISNHPIRTNSSFRREHTHH